MKEFLETSPVEPMQATLDDGPGYRVVCVCGGYGFPSGYAGTARITMVGKALQRAGVAFKVLHCGTSPVRTNTKRAGIYQGIPFEYTTSPRRPANRIARWLVYLRAVAGLTIRLIQLKRARQRIAVYLYLITGPLVLYIGTLCRVLRIPLVQDLCEWWPGEPSCSLFTKWLYRRRIFQLATGALVISRLIETRVRERSSIVKPSLLIHRLPCVVDTEHFSGASEDACSPLLPNFVWCGTWLNDSLFLIRAFAIVRNAGYECTLTIIGPFEGNAAGQKVMDHGIEQGIRPEDVIFAGYLDDRTLAATYGAAAALLLPLWDDDRSRTRLPNKLAEYLASGRPVITSNVGDLTEVLIDEVSVYLGEPGVERDFADRMIAVLRNPEQATQVGAAGQQVCRMYFDYRAHAALLATFFVDCIKQPKSNIRRELVS